MLKNSNEDLVSKKILSPEEITNLVVFLTPRYDGLIGSVSGYIEIDPNGIISATEKSICAYLVGAIETYLVRTNLDRMITVEVHNYLKTDSARSMPPVFTVVFLEGDGITGAIIDECQSIVKFLIGGIRDQDDLFETRSEFTELHELHDGIYPALIDAFVQKFNGKKITKPVGIGFDFEKSNEPEILLSNAFRAPEIIQTNKKVISGYAKMEGYNETPGTLSLYLVISGSCRVSSKVTIFKTNKWENICIGIQSRLGERALSYDGYESRDSSGRKIRVIESVAIVDVSDIVP